MFSPKIISVLMLSIIVSSCQLKSARAQKAEAPAPTANAPISEATPIETAPEETQRSFAEQVHDNMEITLKKNGQTVSAKTPLKRPEARVPADQALGWLKNGNIRFTKNRLRNDGQSIKDIRRLTKEQKPHTIIISCSDSRVPPEVIFDQKLGEIFVVRSAGQSLDHSTIGSIEYALEHLGTNLILIMGHTSCGAVSSAHATAKGLSTGSPHIDHIVKDIQPRIDTYIGKTPSAGYLKESWANIRGVAKDLILRSEITKNLVEQGQVKVAEAIYDMETGVVTFW